MPRLAAALFALLLLLPGVRADARCAPAVGYSLVRVGSGAVAPGGTVLVALEPTRARASAVTLPLATVSLRSGSSTTTATARRLAANLYAFDLPSRAGHYAITPGGLAVDVEASAPAVTTPSSTPAPARPPMGEVRIGSRTTAPTLVLSAASPSDAVGALLTWDDGSWFIAAGGSMIGPGRCTPDLDGFDPIDAGDAVTVRFVGAGGGLSPAATFTAP